MQLKDYQSRVLDKLDAYLRGLKEKRIEAEEFVEFQRSRGKQAELRDYVEDTWTTLNERRELPMIHDKDGVLHIARHVTRVDGIGRVFPHICLKVPTSGGKTILATAAIERINTDYFERQTGFVLWVVPSDAIYRQTWRNLANREHPYRQMLERASGGRVKMLEREDPLTSQDVQNFLCVMVIKLPAARISRKEQRRMFRNTGNYGSFFPEVDDLAANKALLGDVRNLDVADLGDGPEHLTGLSIYHSLGNTIRVIRPIMVVDEVQNTYSPLAREIMRGFNPRFMLELSATPNSTVSNILVDVQGVDLKREQMVKLPINVHNRNGFDWKDLLRHAHDKLKELEKSGERLQAQEGRYVRPIMIVRVDYTGKAQRDKSVHAEDAREFLIKELGVPKDQIRLKTAETDELGNEDLLSEFCPARFIITKDALKEGWDCPFAYVLTVTGRLTAQTAITQLVGRVLRQPETRETGIQALNECYIFCRDQEVKTAVAGVKSALEAEGMGDISGDVRVMGDGDGDKAQAERVLKQERFRHRRILLPCVLHKEGEIYRKFDYDRDILGSLDWQNFSFTKAGEFNPKAAEKLQETVIRINVAKEDGQFELPYGTKVKDLNPEAQFDHAFLVRQLIDVMPNPWQASRILDDAIIELKANGVTDDALFRGRLLLVSEVRRDLRRQVYEASEAIFRKKIEDGEIVFRLVGIGDEALNWELAEELTVSVLPDDRVLRHRNDESLERNLFERIYERELNDLETKVAWYLDQNDALRWWHRIAVKQDYHLQGWQRHKVFPDFLACIEAQEGGSIRFSLLETKGAHLKGNENTEYKTKLFELLEHAYGDGQVIGEIELEDVAETMKFRVLLENGWEGVIDSAL